MDVDPTQRFTPSHRRGTSFRRTLILWFSLIALISSASVGTLTYFARASALRESVYNQLEILRDTAIRDIDLWITERKADLKSWSEMPPMIALCRDHSEGKSNYSEDNRRLLDEIKKAYDYRAVFLADPNTGQAFLSSHNGDRSDFVIPSDILRRIVSQKGPDVSDVYLSGSDGLPEIMTAGPILAPDGARVIGVLAFQFDPSRQLYPGTMLSGRLGKTGEALLINSLLVAQSPLRYHDHAIGRFTLQAEPARRAAAGQKGQVAEKDYRGVPVMAVYGATDAARWGIVVKQDITEIEAPVRDMGWSVLRISAGVLMASLMIGYVLAGTIAGPARRISEVARRIGAGQIEARTELEGPSEMRTIASSLNLMAEGLEAHFHANDALNNIFLIGGNRARVSDLVRDVVARLMTATRSQLGVVYLRQDADDRLEHALTLGGPAEEQPAQLTPESPNQWLAEVARSGQVRVLNDIPSGNELIISTPAGRTQPKAMVGIPLIWSGETIGVIGLASLYNYRDEDLRIAESLRLNFAHSVVACKAHQTNEDIRRELQVKNEELMATNEEVQSTNAELTAVNEELQSQSEELQNQADELRRQAVELEEQRRKVKEADRLKSEFLSNMSHELRTPLNSVMALSQLMLSRGLGKNVEQEAQFLRIIERNGRHLLNLINDILDLSKIEAGRVQFQLAPLDPHELLTHIVETTRPLAMKKNLGLKVQSDPVPVIQSDRDKVSQILLNLLSNAVKFTDRGNIDVRLSAANGRAEFEIRDTGIGIAQRDLEYIFDEFRQVDGSTTRRHEGTGLGLAIARKLSRLLGGDITVQSVPGKGSTFTLSLPLGMAAPSAPLEKNAPPVGTGSKRHILVIDDDPGTGEFLKSHLETAGYRVSVATHGSQGLELAQTIRPFAITLDVFMPEMDGWEVLRSLKSDPRTSGIPVILVTIGADRETGLVLGAAGYLMKPVDRESLLAEIDRVTHPQKVRRVLVVDDDATTRIALGELLSEIGLQAITASNGEEALRKASFADLVILDLLMPDMDGFTVLERLRSRPETRELAVIVLTAKELTFDERTLLLRNSQRIIAKGPTDREQLLKEIRTTLSSLEHGAPHVVELENAIVLVVEDNAVAALQIRSALEEGGFSVIVAPGGAEAIECLKRIVPGAIVLDLMMPEVDGYRVLEEARSMPTIADIPVLVLTAKELTDEDNSRLKRHNVRQLIQKGNVDRLELVRRIRSMLAPPIAPPVSTTPTASSTAETVEEGVASRASSPSLRDGPILIVEDNPDNLITIQAMLEEQGHAHISASDGQAAVEAARSHHPRLILMDLELPIMSGYEAIRRIKGDPSLRETPIVVLTARAMKGDREKALDCGANDYLAKPLDPQAVAEAVRRWIR